VIREGEGENIGGDGKREEEKVTMNEKII